ncbi:MAG: hypothetical protein IJ007_01015 [Oscillospiraceae bacterium]|nr:hypothetical protein [Oscillospiraceae bacterium]
MLKIDSGFTIKKKGLFSLGCIAFAILWVILWFIFPMEWYSLFFASTVGSYVTLVLLATVIVVPLCWLFTIITASNISFTLNYIANVLFIIGVTFLFSAFRYSMWWLVAIAVLLQIAVQTFIIGKAPPYKKKRLKKLSKKHKNISYEKITGGTVKVEPDVDESSEALIKKQPLIAVMWAAVHTIAADVINIALFWLLAYTFNY